MRLIVLFAKKLSQELVLEFIEVKLRSIMLKSFFIKSAYVSYYHLKKKNMLTNTTGEKSYFKLYITPHNLVGPFSFSCGLLFLYMLNLNFLLLILLLIFRYVKIFFTKNIYFLYLITIRTINFLLNLGGESLLYY
jgi:hypothetical protein